jgi:hypothetical protein
VKVTGGAEFNKGMSNKERLDGFARFAELADAIEKRPEETDR